MREALRFIFACGVTTALLLVGCFLLRDALDRLFTTESDYERQLRRVHKSAKDSPDALP